MPSLTPVVGLLTEYFILILSHVVVSGKGRDAPAMDKRNS